MLKSYSVSLFISLFFLNIPAFSQSKADLKTQKLNIEKEINFTSGLLERAKKNKRNSLDYLNALNKQIINKGFLLQNLSIEISLLNLQISKTNNRIVETDKKIIASINTLESLKSEYSKMIFACFKKKGTSNDLIFIISSTDFNQAYKRLIYLKQYASFRMNQKRLIIKSQKKLELEKIDLRLLNDQLSSDSLYNKQLLSLKENELDLINDSRREKELLIKKLTESENFFINKLSIKQKSAKELDDRIRKLIESEIMKIKSNSKNRMFKLTPEALELSAQFSSNEGRLPWPLLNGVIVQTYGKQKHAVFSSIETFNNGIDIATDENAIVRTIFDGTVSRIFFIKGEGKAILINHGEYFSVYSGLKQVSVKTGDKLLAKEEIGIVFTDDSEGKSELHFEIWKGYDKKDPSKWLFKAY